MNTHLLHWSPAVILVIAGSTQSLAAGPFGAEFNLSALNGTNGFVCNGIAQGHRSGFSVASAGDVNGDGIDDALIGAYRAGANNSTYNGETYVVFGDVGVGASGTIEMSSLNGTNGFVIRGINITDLSGISVSCAGDVNGDGIDDLIIGAKYAQGLYSAFVGEAYVVYGAVGIGASGVFDLTTINGLNGFTCFGAITGDLTGISVSSAGDVNGDGFDDVIVGASGAYANGYYATGKSYVVFGGASIGSSVILPFMNGTDGFVCTGVDTDDNSGYSVSGAGDVNGDGYDDLVIGAKYAEPGGMSSGESYVVFGGAGVGAGGSIALSTLNGTNGFTCSGIDEYDRCGFSVSSAGDINGDGFDDVIIGAWAAYPNGAFSAGESYLIFGSASVGAGGTVDLATLNGTNGLVINGFDPMGDSGISVSSAGDVNDDGIGDLIIGASGADSNGVGSTGQSYVVFGDNSPGAWTASLNLSDLQTINGATGDIGFIINGVDLNDRGCRSVSGAGDVNGDGADDLIIGAPLANPNGLASGESYIVFGIADTALAGDLNDDCVVDTADLGILLGQFGTAGPGADINGDGVVDTADLGILLGGFGDSCN